MVPDPDADADPDPSLFIIDLFLSFSANYFFKALLSFFKDKKSKRSHKTIEIKVFLTIFV
jgi:hypothetical protein